jgi:hypothetical protein
MEILLSLFIYLLIVFGFFVGAGYFITTVVGFVVDYIYKWFNKK